MVQLGIGGASLLPHFFRGFGVSWPEVKLLKDTAPSWTELINQKAWVIGGNNH
jgi:hypothetical protein